ncbi:hypothetical protein HYDPIDRAFT_33493 [Hydnomerulius pinastri MD-312]|uniref:Unplaced genomic scaffold scaffold_63, whole genome shotgun sequence n=1 Tax=Hydnomerulius pinastri MD-312 TaxID=994086 RepID=A0A0C9VN56_9AGAM|nr:hypothetical protein HYDPIDRAFT_33493 [Hydnomerulius pinastri MD-312]
MAFQLLQVVEARLTPAAGNLSPNQIEIPTVLLPPDARHIRSPTPFVLTERLELGPFLPHYLATLDTHSSNPPQSTPPPPYSMQLQPAPGGSNLLGQAKPPTLLSPLGSPCLNSTFLNPPPAPNTRPAPRILPSPQVIHLFQANTKLKREVQREEQKEKDDHERTEGSGSEGEVRVGGKRPLCTTLASLVIHPPTPPASVASVSLDSSTSSSAPSELSLNYPKSPTDTSPVVSTHSLPADDPAPATGSFTPPPSPKHKLTTFHFHQTTNLAYTIFKKVPISSTVQRIGPIPYNGEIFDGNGATLPYPTPDSPFLAMHTERCLFLDRD